jgi:ankyrin repeat protein
MPLQVRVLVEEGKADLSVQDRWGTTPLDEAMRTGSRAVMDYLRGLNAPTQKDDERTVEFLYAASRGNTARLRHVSCLSTAMTPHARSFTRP